MPLGLAVSYIRHETGDFGLQAYASPATRTEVIIPWRRR